LGGPRRRTQRRDSRASADALLIRPDAYVAWAAEAGQAEDTAVAGLREALVTWFGKPA
jgi:hypothetical protein